MRFFVGGMFFLIFTLGISKAGNSPIPHSRVTIPRIFSDHVVLQRSTRVWIWGTGTPGLVTVSVAGRSNSTRVAPSGHWRVALDHLPVGGPYVMTVNNVAIQDVAVGDVWLASGQSNMTWFLSLDPAINAEALRVVDKNVRIFFQPQTTSSTPIQDSRKSGWSTASESVANWSTIAFYFARKMESKRHVPVGIIDAAVAGTYLRQWMSSDVLRDHRAFRRFADIATCYNAMIAPFAGLQLSGALWYQGESDAKDVPANVSLYEPGLRLLIGDWRKKWGSDFPFYIVQLPNVGKPSMDPNTYSGFARVREAQLKVSRTVPKTSLAVTLGLGGQGIHSPNKAAIADRLALSVEGFHGPIYRRYSVSGSAITVFFDQPIVLRHVPHQFAVAAANRKFVWATGIARGNSITISSPSVGLPVAARYGWADDPTPTIYTRGGIPAAPFRTDGW